MAVNFEITNYDETTATTVVLRDPNTDEEVGGVLIEHDGEKLSIVVTRIDEATTGPVEVTVR